MGIEWLRLLCWLLGHDWGDESHLCARCSRCGVRLGAYLRRGDEAALRAAERRR